MFNALRLTLIVGLVWLIVFWTITDPTGLINRMRQLLNLRGFLIGALNIIMLLQALSVLSLPLPFSVPVQITLFGLALFILGLTLASWAKLTMKDNWGVPGQHDLTRQRKLVTNGPFIFSRNPIYVGLLLFFVGFELSLASWLIVLIFPLMYLTHKAVLQEERLLANYFDQEYANYVSRVPRFI